MTLAPSLMFHAIAVYTMSCLTRSGLYQFDFTRYLSLVGWFYNSVHNIHPVSIHATCPCYQFLESLIAIFFTIIVADHHRLV